MRLEDTPGPINWEAAAKLYEERLREAYALAQEVVMMVDDMSEAALRIGLEGTSEWDEIAGGAGMFGVQDQARDFLRGK